MPYELRTDVGKSRNYPTKEIKRAVREHIEYIEQQGWELLRHETSHPAGRWVVITYYKR